MFKKNVVESKTQRQHYEEERTTEIIDAPHVFSVPSTSSPVAGPPRFKNKTPTDTSSSAFAAA
jgi:hypothetical protein